MGGLWKWSFEELEYWKYQRVTDCLLVAILIELRLFYAITVMFDKRPSSLTMKKPDSGVDQRSVYDPKQTVSNTILVSTSYPVVNQTLPKLTGLF